MVKLKQIHYLLHPFQKGCCFPPVASSTFYYLTSCWMFACSECRPWLIKISTLGPWAGGSLFQVLCNWSNCFLTATTTHDQTETVFKKFNVKICTLRFKFYTDKNMPLIRGNQTVSHHRLSSHYLRMIIQSSSAKRVFFITPSYRDRCAAGLLRRSNMEH